MTVQVVKLPDVGEGVAQAEIVEWHVGVGDLVKEDQILAAVMTDKATVEILSPFAGVVVDLGGELGSTLSVGACLVGIQVEGSAAGAGAKPSAASASGVQESEMVLQASIASNLLQQQNGAYATDESATSSWSEESGVKRPIASPAVRARAREAGIDLTQVQGSAAAGRITSEDLDRFINGGSVVGQSNYRKRNDAVELVKVLGLRRKIAERMAESTRRIAHFSYIEEIDVTAIEEARASLNERRGSEREKLTVLPFVVAALVLAIRDFPEMNGTFDDEIDVVTRRGAVHVGIATQTPAGLMVPVLRHAEALDLWESAAEIKRLAEAARQGSAAREDLIGSTITVTSLGELGGIATTPVINRPELAIVGINRIMVRPVWQHSQFVPRKMMNLSSSFDHRIIDGYGAAQFIRRIKELIETPALLFIGV